MKKVLILLTLSLLCAACNRTDANYDRDTKRTHKDCGEDESNPDWQITMKVKKMLVTDGDLSSSAKFISVTTNDGVVTLSGTVSRRDEIDKIVRKVKNVSGVRRVDNQLTVSS